MKTLVISDKLWTPEWMGMDSSEWCGERPSAEGYELVILDLYFGPPGRDGCCSLEKQDAYFYELGAEIAKSLQAGGVVIALLGPLAVTSRDLGKIYPIDQLPTKNDYQYEGKFTETLETSYEWLDQGFLEETRIDTKFAKVSEGISVVSPGSEMDRYVSRWAKKYWITISGIDFFGKSKTEGTIIHQVAQPQRWNCSSVAHYPIKILAVGKHTKLPVAVAMQYMNWDGILLLLPPCELVETTQPALNEEVTGLLNTLKYLAAGIKEDFAIHRIAEHEDWVYEHRAPQAKTLASEIEKVREKERELTKRLEVYDQMLALVDGTGEPLMDSVVALFDKPDEGLKVEKTEKGAPIDLFLSDSKGRTLAIEVTGIRHALKKDDPHWADFLGYMPEHNAKNEHGRVERIVLVVNTECKTKLEARNRSNDISGPVKKTAADNHICVIRSCDLYQLWLETLTGKPTQEVFDKLFNYEGTWEQ